MFNKNKIQSVVAREVLDSRGNPTVACRVTLSSGVSAEAKVPSGASTGSHEALELRDGGKRYGGNGVLKAVAHVNHRIAPLLKGIDVSRQQDIDHVMIELDGTLNKSQLGANATLSVSLACAQASALARRIPLWKSLRSTFHFSHQPRLPIATMNVLNGGAHAGWVMDIQECMIVPKQRTFAERLRAGAETFYALKKILKDEGFVGTVGDEGGFAPHLKSAEASFDLLIKAIRKAGYRPGKDINLATDVAASEFYDRKSKLYRMKVEGKNYTADQLLARYERWQKNIRLNPLRTRLPRMIGERGTKPIRC